MVPLSSIESFTHVNDSNTKGLDVKVIGYKFYHKRFIYTVLVNNEITLEKQCKHKSDINPFNLIREVLYPDTHQEVLNIINTLKEDLFKYEVYLKWDEYEFCTVDTYLYLKGEMKDYYWELKNKALRRLKELGSIDWFFKSNGYSELCPDWNIPFD